MNKKILFGFVFMLLLSFSLVSAAYEDDFNRSNSNTLGTATNGNVWVESDNAIQEYEILNNAMFFDFVSGTGSVTATLSIVNITSTYFSFTLRPQVAANDLFIYFEDASAFGPYLRSKASTCEFESYDGSTWNAILNMDCASNYFVEFSDIDYTAKTFDVSINGTKYSDDFDFRTTASSLNTIEFSNKNMEFTFDAFSSVNNTVPSLNQTVVLTIVDEWNTSKPVNNVTVNIAGNTFTNSTGNIIYTNVSVNASTNYTINITSPAYFDKIDYFITAESQTIELKQSEIRFNATELYTNNSVNANFTINGIQATVFNLSEGSYTVTATSAYFNKTLNFNVSPLDNLTYTVSGLYDAILEVNATDTFASTWVTGFNISANSGLFTVLENDNNTGTATLGLLQGYNYTLNFSKNNYLPESANITINASETSYTFTVFGLVNVQFNFYDEQTLQAVNNVSFDVLSSAYSNSFDTGGANNYLLTSLPEEVYEIRYTANDYSLRSYYVLMPLTNSDQANISLYLLDEGNSTLFLRQVTDQGNNPLNGYYLQVQRPYASDDNSSLIYRTVEIALIDSQGDAVFNAIANTQQYRFRVLDTTLQLVNILTPSFLIDSSSNIIGTESANTMENFNTATSAIVSLTFQNSTKSFIFDYTAPVTIYQACLVVINTSGLTSSKTTTCSSSNSDTITTTINPDLNTSYEANAYIYTDANTYILVASDSRDYSKAADRATVRYIGAFLYLLTMLVVIGIGAFTSPVAAVILGIAATAAFSVSFLGLFTFSTFLTGGLLIFGIIILLLTRESSV